MRFLFSVFLLGALLSPAGVWASGRKPSPESFFQGKPGEPVSVKRFAKAYGFDKVSSEKDRIVLTGNVHTLELYRGSRRAVLNGTLIWLNQPLEQEQGTWVLRVKDVQRSLHPVLRPAEALTGNGYQVVVLDPGHGGHDSGATSAHGLLEKEVALDVARRVRAILQRQGVRVYLTRHNDRFVELDERPRRASIWDADALVSIHANAGQRQARGVETFVLGIPGSLSTNADPNSAAPTTTHPGNQHDAANMALTHAIHDTLRRMPNTVDRGVKRARFAVLRTATCPATLVEIGFLSHPEESKRLQSNAHRDEIARSIARGIDNYLRAVKTAAMTDLAATEEKQP